MGINAKPFPLLNLPSIRLDGLRSGDASESKRLSNTCRTHRFFYLDLSGDDVICQQWEDMLVAMEDYFEQPLDVKL